MEHLEHYLCDAFTVCLWIQGGFRQQNGMLVWMNTELIVEGMMPYLLHVVPVRDYPVFDRIFKCKHTPSALCFISDIRVFVMCADHHIAHLRPTHNRREHRVRCISAGEACLAHAAAVVDHQGNDLLRKGHDRLDCISGAEATALEE